MADIISLDERLKEQRDKQLTAQKKKRLTSLRLVMECTNCPRKCAKCGSQLEPPEPRILSPELPLRLCAGCWEEYRIYQQFMEGHSPPRDLEVYQSPAWMEVWKSWVEYQTRLHFYRNSLEFKKLMVELSKEEE
jgi:hypothetical protein